mgnify:CR=1 FL=1
MVVGVLRLKLMIPGAHSLKDKRRALRGLKDRLRAQHNVSVAEVDAHDVWQTAVLGVAAVGVDRASAEGALDRAAALARMSSQVVLARAEKDFV